MEGNKGMDSIEEWKYVGEGIFSMKGERNNMTCK
jgi:hypothetical protein